jgi:hypothetical protein
MQPRPGQFRPAKINTLRDRRYVNYQGFFDVEYRLLPMCVLRMGTGTKPNRFMATLKGNIEPRNNSMNKILSRSAEFKLRQEGQIRYLAGGEVQVQDAVRVSDHGLDVHGVD